MLQVQGNILALYLSWPAGVDFGRVSMRWVVCVISELAMGVGYFGRVVSSQECHESATQGKSYFSMMRPRQKTRPTSNDLLQFQGNT